MTNQTKTSVPFDARTMIENVHIQGGSISSISNRLEQLEKQINGLVQKMDCLNAVIST